MGELVHWLDRIPVDDWTAWPCPECGEEQASPNPEREGSLCGACDEAIRQADKAAALAERLDGVGRGSLLGRVGCPRRYQSDFRTPRVWPMDPRCKEIPINEWQGDPWSVLLVGPTGTGKTFLATEILYQWLQAGKTGRWVRAGDIPGLIWSYSDGERQRHVLETVNLLLVDDLGRGHPGKALEAVVSVVSARYDWGRSTIVTSNRSTADKNSDAEQGGCSLPRMDPALWDRLKAGLMIKTRGKSRRKVS